MSTGSALRHTQGISVSFQLPAVVGRQWLTEAGGYAVFAPTDGSSTTLRVAVYAAPKPVSAMHAGTRTQYQEELDRYRFTAARRYGV